MVKMNVLLFLLLHLLEPPGLLFPSHLAGNGVGAEDLFCGQLQVHKQKWLSKLASTLSHQNTADLKECIDLCCSISHCSAITFVGFLVEKRINNNAEVNNSSSSSANCLLFNCGQDCVAAEQTIAREGVLTVLIVHGASNKSEEYRVLPVPSTPHQFLLPISTPALADQKEDDFNHTHKDLYFNNSGLSAAIGRVLPIDNDEHPQPLEEGSSTWASPALPDDFNFSVPVGELAPVWAVGLAVVVGVVCGGLSLALIGVYLCYKRHRTRMRTAEINTIKAPTLHAFNPQT